MNELQREIDRCDWEAKCTNSEIHATAWLQRASILRNELVRQNQYCNWDVFQFPPLPPRGSNIGKALARDPQPVREVQVPGFKKTLLLVKR